MARLPPRMLCGIDVLLEQGQDKFRGQRLAVLSGAGAGTRHMAPTASALAAQKALRIVALFGPEHGLRGAAPAGTHIESTHDTATGLPIYSLYGDHREPTDAMLDGIDTLLVDLQDVGLRYYTYASTLSAVLRSAARRGVAVVVLDRPNPLTGLTMEGPITEPPFQSFVSAARIPIRHGLTLGEVGRWINEREGIGAQLRVIPMQGWRREWWFERTGLQWAPSSPNLPSVDTCITYTATCLIEGTPVSEGRGTAQPFQVLGAPWIDAEALAMHLNRLDLAGVRFRPTWFCPTTSKHVGEICNGVQLHIDDRRAFEGVRTGLQVLACLHRLYPERMGWIVDRSGTCFIDLLLGTDGPRLAIERGDAVDEVVAAWQPALRTFSAERGELLLYDAPSTAGRRADGALSETEAVNPRTVDIDTLTTRDILRAINDEDALVPEAVALELPAIAAAVERVVDAFRAGGRLIYVGAGTSGRLGALDAAECPPTYGTEPWQVPALIAGGPAAMTGAVELAEDNEERGAQEIEALSVTARDVVIGIAASGRTPYVVGALRRARLLGAFTVALVGNAEGQVARTANLVIAPRTGPEVIAGSTRMKAGTAQKLILNMISTAAMIAAGRTFGNLMVNMRSANRKLHDRKRRIVAQATQVDEERAAHVLAEAGDDMKTAIVMLLANVNREEARHRLDLAAGIVRKALATGGGKAG